MFPVKNTSYLVLKNKRFTEVISKLLNKTGHGLLPFYSFLPLFVVYLFFKTTEVCDSTTVKMLTSIMLTYIGPKKSGDDNYFISRHFITYSSGNCEIVQQPVDEELTKFRCLLSKMASLWP